MLCPAATQKCVAACQQYRMWTRLRHCLLDNTYECSVLPWAGPRHRAPPLPQVSCHSGWGWRRGEEVLEELEVLEDRAGCREGRLPPL